MFLKSQQSGSWTEIHFGLCLGYDFQIIRVRVHRISIIIFSGRLNIFWVLFKVWNFWTSFLNFGFLDISFPISVTLCFQRNKFWMYLMKSLRELRNITQAMFYYGSIYGLGCGLFKAIFEQFNYLSSIMQIFLLKFNFIN